MQPLSKKKVKRFSAGTYWREILALLMLLLAVVFFRSERKELQTIGPQLSQANSLWLITGFAITGLYIFFQAAMYKKAFDAIGLRLKWKDATALFLKRNFISVFLPAGGVSSLAYSPSQIRRQRFNQSQVHQASALYGFAGLLTVFLAGLPVVVYTVISHGQFRNAWTGLLILVAVMASLFLAVRSVQQKKSLYVWIGKKFPSLLPSIDELFAANVHTRHFISVILYSLGVELCGMLHIYIAMLALGATPSFGAAAAAYIIVVLLMIVSPFLRGLGAVELSMVYVLEQFGYNSFQALSITVLYRVFEFWIPLLLGFLAFAWKGRKLFFRLTPALLTLTLGIINIISVVTPPIHHRITILKEYLPLSAIHASNLLILFVGLGLLITSAFLIKGLRSAWIIAIILSVVSLVGHLSKALDYEEAAIAVISLIMLLTTAQQYRIRSSIKWIRTGLATCLTALAAVLLFGFISFYFIDKKHFGIDFTWQQSLLHTFKSFLLIEDRSLHPITRFGHEFIWLIRIIGFLTWGLLLYSLVRPKRFLHDADENHREKARFILEQYGNSSVDYFKLYKDKLFFLSDLHDAFIAYRIAGGFAIVLEEPVCSPEHKVDVLREFDQHCRKMGLKPAYYRVDENSMPWFAQLRKSKLMIGQEAILDVKKFSLEGKDKKSLRNGLNSLERKGYKTLVYEPPHSPELMDELKRVSDNWLHEFEKEETVFSQGMFDEKELSHQPIIAVGNDRGEIEAFLNIIPDYAEDDCTYDLIRKTTDAPGAAMDALIVRLIQYAGEHQKQFLNLGMAPMTGITQPDNTAEQLIRLATARIRRFQHYKGLREFKEKYATLWENKYLVYDNDYDLLQLPLALNTVMKP